MKVSNLTLAMLIGAAVAILISGFSSFAKAAEQIPNEVLRLHILANSDSESDQNLKYAVRDHIIKEFSECFSSCKTLSECEQAARRNLTKIKKSAEDFIKNSGYNYNVNASVTNMYFTTRKYEKITLPAGYYDALRIEIGEGRGKNWWCVMFPPLCLPAAGKDFVLTKEQSKIIEESKEYEIRFLLFEWLFGHK